MNPKRKWAGPSKVSRLAAIALTAIFVLTGCRFPAQKTQFVPLEPKAFVWGISMNLFPYPALHDQQRFEQVTEEQIRALKNLSVTVARFTYSIEEPNRSVYIARRLKEEGIRPYIILEDYVKGPQPDEQAHGYQFAKDAIAQIGQYADYYQLANEVGGSAIKSPAFPGTKLTDYDTNRLNLTLNFITGASRAAHDFDPTALRVVTMNSLHTAIIQEALIRRIDFDILGWNWFSDFGTELANPIMNQQTGERYPFLATLKSLGKPLWVTELSRRGGAADGNELAQSDFLKTAVPLAVSAGFRGIFPFTLVEDVVGLPGYGLLEPQQDKTGAWFIARPREAFFTYQNLVKDTTHD